MRVNVSLSVVLDAIGKVKLDLFNGDLREVDEFTTRFKSSEEIRDKFKNRIDCFLADNINMINSFKGNKRGRVVLTYLDNELNTRYIPVLFKKDKSYTDEKYCYLLLKRLLSESTKDLYDMVNKKYYIFSRYMKELVSYAKITKDDKKYKDAYKEILRIFSHSENSYFYVRNLTNYYRNRLPRKIEIASGTIRNIDDSLIESTIREKETDDEFFNYCVTNEDYELLYKYYDIDRIIKNSRDEMRPVGSYPKKTKFKS